MNLPITLTDAYVRAAHWNSLRYSQEYNAELQYNLLSEELKETIDATSSVEHFDGLADICFVAMGGLWKSGSFFDIRKFTEVFNYWVDVVGKSEQPALSYFKDYLTAVADFEEPDADHLNYSCLVFCNICAFEYAPVPASRSFQALLECLLAVCDSNDTKVVKKTDSAIKANIDKGAAYVPPTNAIKRILVDYNMLLAH